MIQAGTSRHACGGCAQAQCILFRRYPDVLEPFKYGGYPLLLAAVTLPEDEGDAPADGKAAHFLSPEQAPLLQVPPSTWLSHVAGFWSHGPKGGAQCDAPLQWSPGTRSRVMGHTRSP